MNEVELTAEQGSSAASCDICHTEPAVTPRYCVQCEIDACEVQASLHQQWTQRHWHSLEAPRRPAG